MVSDDVTLESLFRDHTREEIESARDNFAQEIEKRTSQLKTTVKEKYRDIVETSGIIHSMKLSLSNVEQLTKDLISAIGRFYETEDKDFVIPSNLKKANFDPLSQLPTRLNEADWPNTQNEFNQGDVVRTLSQKLADIWDHYDTGDLKSSIAIHNEAMQLVEKARGFHQEVQSEDTVESLSDMIVSLARTKEIIKRSICNKIRSAEPNQIGVISSLTTDSNSYDDTSESNLVGKEDLYGLSLQASIEPLARNLRRNIFDHSPGALIRRYQPCDYFNTKTNQLEPNINDATFSTSIAQSQTNATCFVQVPKFISSELSMFLYEVCRTINTIAGFSLTRASILEGLSITMKHIVHIYSDLVPLVGDLKADCKRRRALQLHYDLMYLRVLVITSKGIELIEHYDPILADLLRKFELMLDSVELYMISAALHENVMKLCQSTTRLYGLLIPHP